MVFGIEDASRRVAGAILPRLDFTQPVLKALKGSSVQRIEPLTAFRACMKLIKSRRSALLVAEPGSKQMLGLVTERDFVTKMGMESGAVTRTLVTDLMTPAAALHTAPASYTLMECARLMAKERVRHLPVVEEEEVRAVLSMREISQHISHMLSRRDVAEADVSIGDMLSAIRTPGLAASLPVTATVADAVEQMRATSFGALLVLGGDGFGIFTERDYVHNVLPCCAAEEQSAAHVSLRKAARWATDEVGYSRRMMEAAAEDPSVADYYWPDTITCVERATPVRDCLRLMLGNGLLYVPVIDESDRPVDVISMRDVNLFMAQEGLSVEGEEGDGAEVASA